MFLWFLVVCLGLPAGFPSFPALFQGLCSCGGVFCFGGVCFVFCLFRLFGFFWVRCLASACFASVTAAEILTALRFAKLVLGSAVH